MTENCIYLEGYVCTLRNNKSQRGLGCGRSTKIHSPTIFWIVTRELALIYRREICTGQFYFQDYLRPPMIETIWFLPEIKYNVDSIYKSIPSFEADVTIITKDNRTTGDAPPKSHLGLRHSEISFTATLSEDYPELSRTEGNKQFLIGT